MLRIIRWCMGLIALCFALLAQAQDFDFEATKRAAEQGDMSAQFSLGRMYAEGWGVAKDNAEAVKWYIRAAEQGSMQGIASAKSILLEIEEYVGSSQWTEGELRLFTHIERAAGQGHAESQYNLGMMYAEGVVVPQNDTQAVEWLRKSAEQGYSNAQYKLGEMYAKGWGVAQDEAEAVKWYKKAAEHKKAAEQWPVEEEKVHEAMKERE